MSLTRQYFKRGVRQELRQLLVCFDDGGVGLVAVEDERFGLDAREPVRAEGSPDIVELLGQA
ncbi:hypothetical protein GCM10009744_27220 [Kribbella alba]|uniref:Uncharacterized protein n=1 Tax=Kribbella alba TaxID=190197 RepID=A0ABP4R4Y7_9ACTN